MTIVTFDFDDTLTQTQWDPQDECFKYIGPNLTILQILRDNLQLGNEVHIVTSRFGPEMNKDGDTWDRAQPAILPFLREHLSHDLEKLASVHWCGSLKRDKLAELGSSRHYDDDKVELSGLPDGCTGVLVTTLHGLE
jgi:hypothetical protein